MSNNPPKIHTDESSSYYSNSSDPYANSHSNQNFQRQINNTYDNNKYNLDQFKSSLNDSKAIGNDLSQDEELQNYFIKIAKDDMNILPTDYRKKVNRLNSIFVVSSCLYPIYCLAHLLKDYPEINKFSKRNLMFSTGIYLGLILILKAKSNAYYKESYYHLRSQYSTEHIRYMINNYHYINKSSLLTDRSTEKTESTNN